MYSDDDLISSIRDKKKTPEAPTEPTDALEDDYLGPAEEATEAPPETEADRLKRRIAEILK